MSSTLMLLNLVMIVGIKILSYTLTDFLRMSYVGASEALDAGYLQTLITT